MVSVGSWFVYFIAFTKLFSSAAFRIGYIYSAEFYPTKIRATGTGMASAMVGISGILTPTLSTILSDQNVHFPYCVYAALSIIAVLANYFLDIETHMRPLDTRVKEKL